MDVDSLSAASTTQSAASDAERIRRKIFAHFDSQSLLTKLAPRKMSTHKASGGTPPPVRLPPTSPLASSYLRRAMVAPIPVWVKISTKVNPLQPNCPKIKRHSPLKVGRKSFPVKLSLKRFSKTKFPSLLV